MNYGFGDCGCGGQQMYAAPYAYSSCGFNNGFALIVVLFILLIIIGASCYAR